MQGTTFQSNLVILSCNTTA